MQFFFLGDITEKRRSTILAFSRKFCPGIKTSKINGAIFLGSSVGPQTQQTYWKKYWTEKNDGIIQTLNAHYVFL